MELQKLKKTFLISYKIQTRQYLEFKQQLKKKSNIYDHPVEKKCSKLSVNVIYDNLWRICKNLCKNITYINKNIEVVFKISNVYYIYFFVQHAPFSVKLMPLLGNNHNVQQKRYTEIRIQICSIFPIFNCAREDMKSD